MTANWLIANAKNGVSSMELHRSIGVTQKTAWFMLHRIRDAMQTGSFAKASGRVETDETFVGGKARNMHKHVRAHKITGTGGKDKTAVMGIPERGGKVRTRSARESCSKPQEGAAPGHRSRERCARSRNLHGRLKSPLKVLDAQFLHQFVDHAVEYVKGHVHTNGMENFWCLLKRTLKGTYVSVAAFHLFRYVDERAFPLQ